MGDPLPPDPYHALGVAKDATAAAIKTQYRKLVLKCHPDKVKDEAAKQEASDNFHKIQSAWEIIGDEARRARYDAQVKLQELRRDVFRGHGDHGENRRSGGVDVRTASYKVPTESPRGGYFDARGPDRYGPKVSPQYEERRPSYASVDEYYEEPPRPTARKYDDYERTPKRAPPREERERPRAKENERSSRKEKSRRTDKDVRRDRANKQAYVEVQEEYVSDEYERAQRTPPDDETLRRARADFFDPYARESPAAYDERTRKTFQNLEEARAHMERSKGVNRPHGESAPREPSPQEPLPRPEPVRMGSSKEKVERLKRDARPSLFGGVRHGSGDRPKSSRTKTDKEQKSSDEDRRNSRRKEESSKKVPTLSQSKSTPPDARPSNTRQRSYTMEEEHTEQQIPQVKRSETMPPSPTGGPPPSRDSKRQNTSRLRPETASYPTPDTTPEPETTKYPYGKNQFYADDDDFIPTPDGFKSANPEPYRTQEYVPSRETGRQSTREATRAPRFSASPEPIKQTERERSGRRSSSARHTTQKPSMPRTTSTQYVVEPEGVRPAPSRENSGRDSLRNLSRENSGGVRTLYGEIPRATAVRSGSPRAHYIVPPPEDVQYAPRYKESDFKVQTGYARTRDPEKPSYSRQSSGLAREQRRAVYAS